MIYGYPHFRGPLCGGTGTCRPASETRGAEGRTLQLSTFEAGPPELTETKVGTLHLGTAHHCSLGVCGVERGPLQLTHVEGSPRQAKVAKSGTNEVVSLRG